MDMRRFLALAGLLALAACARGRADAPSGDEFLLADGADPALTPAARPEEQGRMAMADPAAPATRPEDSVVTTPRSSFPPKSKEPASSVSIAANSSARCPWRAPARWASSPM